MALWKLAWKVAWQEVPDRKINEEDLGMKPQCTTAAECLRELATVMEHE